LSLSLCDFPFPLSLHAQRGQGSFPAWQNLASQMFRIQGVGFHPCVQQLCLG
jgi:hypothetical protein